MERVKKQFASLEFPAGELYLEPTLEFVARYASKVGIEANRGEGLKEAVRYGIRIISKKLGQNSADESCVKVSVYETQGHFYVEILNRGEPVFLDGENDDPEVAKLYEYSKDLEKLSLENLGRNGQILILSMRLGVEAAKGSLPKIEVVDDLDRFGDEEIVIRDLIPGEETVLSQLFYRVYSYDYINEFVYYPEKIRAMINEGKLISIVASLPGGRLIGHVGLLKWSEVPAVYEPCLGIVDPQVKSRGVFGKVFAKTMDRVNALPMQYAFFDFVTNHEFSQRLVAKYQPVDLALFIGCQSKATQAKLERLGLGMDPKDSDRYSLLLSIIPRVEHPFGKEICLPNNIGELLGFLLEPLKLSWYPASRFQILPAKGEYQTHLQPAQNAVVFDLVQPGREALEKILNEWRLLLRNGYQYAAIELPAETTGLANLYDLISDSGFFIAGFVPYHHGFRLGIRFQAIGPTKVAFDEIKVYNPLAKKLLEIVRLNYERNNLL